MKEADKVKLMLLAWNYHTQAQGKIFKQNLLICNYRLSIYIKVTFIKITVWFASIINDLPIACTSILLLMFFYGNRYICFFV